MVGLSTGDKQLILVGQNNDSLKIFERSVATPRSLVKLKNDEVCARLRFDDGRSQFVEVGFGNTYLSQSSRVIAMTPRVQTIEVFDRHGNRSRTLPAY